jgi:hypothetical protein
MRLQCEASNAGSDIRCRVCGQGFLLHWSAESPESPQIQEEQSLLRVELMRELRRHHAASTDHPAAHPRCCFHVHAPELQPEASLPFFENSPAWATA